MKLATKLISRFAKATEGSAAVEFAILLPVIMILLVGTIDLGHGFHQQMKIRSAANTGLQHAMATQGADARATADAVSHALWGSPAEVKVEGVCRCGTASGDCGTTCTERFIVGQVTLTSRSPFFDREVTLKANFDVMVGRP